MKWKIEPLKWRADQGPSSEDPSLLPHPRFEAINYSLARVHRRLEERQATRMSTQRRKPCCSIFRLPTTLRGINRKFEEPEIVSIGPYQRGKAHLLDFEEHKWFFLELFLARGLENLRDYIEDMTQMMEKQMRDCCSEPVLMSSGDFVEMMLLDGCFVTSWIITRFSQDEILVANLFNKLGKSLVFNVHNRYLSEQFRNIKSFYCSNWATMMRTYFCSLWSFISVFSAFLIILFTAVQTVIAVIS
ncbi:hypothetical protein CDL15_Pgr025176 [Punica granatum]|uniref:Uncharacterized protein n=1 Tax=Punica granatum TaxID=22663 RepID=A0A218W922_PUNGR|nr:hypothetical protein CDL15_Pgr025176 [Punica granatum]